ncbi:TetR/AcrR family transcriptional regulator [Lactobacillus taiwanensis]|uniref:TetR/AcrR family transcriptional regulator n=1 Tax=Lactobacillus taiwanensis TaxID=508451 RepID=UPI0025B0C4B0|nr:TetR/AcrR family transcriptional regulator [Lactobacillus taiwanensis]
MQISGFEDLRVQKTISNIYKAFEELILEKDYSKITVTELAKRAQINKKTFYRYYPTLDDLLSEMQAQYSKQYLEIVKDFHYPRDLKKSVRAFFEFSAKQDPAYDKITVSQGSYSGIRQQMIDQVEKNTWEQSEDFKKLKTWQQKLLLTFIQDVTLAGYRRWIEDNKEESMDEMINLTADLLQGGVDKLFNNLNNTEETTIF